jgi:hypothetical protein
MPKLSVPEFAASLNPPITRQRINELCNRGDLVREKRKIDTDHPHNARWLAFRKECPPPPTPVGRWGAKAPRQGLDVQTIDEEQITDMLLRIVEAQDIRSVSYAEVQKIQKIETALKARVEREHKRRDLIERTLVRTVFGKIYQIESNEIKTLGGKLAPEVSGLLGIEDPVMTLMVESRIEGELLKSLAHIKRVINDMLLNIDAAVLE